MHSHSLLRGSPNPGIESGSPALQADSLPSQPSSLRSQEINELINLKATLETKTEHTLVETVEEHLL